LNAQAIVLGQPSQSIKGYLDVALQNFYVDPDTSAPMQEVGLVFQNLGGLASAAPTYAVVKLQYVEHIHGDATHSGNAAITHDGDGPVQAFNLGDTGSPTKTELVHVRFKTSDQEQNLPPLAYDVHDCTRGALTGRTGPGAVPKIKFSWNWNDIEDDTCDASNPNAVYCDATQFSMMLTRKLHKLDEFLAANNYQFACPEHPVTTATDALNDQDQSRSVPQGQLGVKQVTSDYDGTENKVDVRMVFENKTTANQTFDYGLSLYSFGDNTLQDSCSETAININASATATKTCTFSNLSSGLYYTTISLGSSTTADLNDWLPILSVAVSGDPNYGAPGDCWLPRTTQEREGTPIINLFVEKCMDESGCNVAWDNPSTPIEEAGGIQNLDDLRGLVRFDALLIKDGYSMDFRRDLVAYSEQGFVNTPAFFDQSSAGEWKDYFLDEDKLVFRRKYLPFIGVLPAPGLYQVEMAALFDDDWKLFDNGLPDATVAVMMYHLREPSPNSPFYSLPFDGLVGLQGASLDRQGYGAEYDNFNDEIALHSVTTADVPKTFESTGSNGVMKVNTEWERDFRKINSLTGSRGDLLSVRAVSPTEKRLVFSPSYATPVLLKTSHGLDTEPFSTFYSVELDGSPVSTGNVLTYWEGCGACYDFRGVPVTEAFPYLPDRAATQRDRIQNWETAYGVDWPYATLAGDVYLRTIFYTPTTAQSARLFLVHPINQAKVINPMVEGGVVDLQGILTPSGGMEYNSPVSSQKIKALSDIFELVKDDKVCVTNNGIRTRYWWNPKAVYLQQGRQRMIHADCVTLQDGINCSS
jgi:hypothetical protein